VLARPDFVEPPRLHFNTCERVVYSKFTFAQGFDDKPGRNVMSFSHVLIEASDSQKAYGFGYLAASVMSQQA